MDGSIDASVLQLAHFLGLHAQNAYLTGLDLRRTLTEYEAVGLFQQDRGYLVAAGDQLVIAFAGSRRAETTFGLVDWCDNLTARLDEHTSGNVHAGCLRKVKLSIKDEMLRGLEKLYTGQTILITGHSRGGALATLAAHALQQEGFLQVAVFTFGAPKVGDKSFADSCRFPVYRFECEGDPVPLLPPMQDYAAVGDGIWLADDGRIHTSRGPVHDLVLKGISWGERILQVLRQREITPDMLSNHAMACYLDRLQNGRLVEVEPRSGGSE